MQSHMHAHELQSTRNASDSAAFIRIPLRLIFPAILAAGCASHSTRQATTRPSNIYQRQDAALADPFGYSPNMDQPDISGGDLGHYDRAGMKKDIDHVLNP
jgi:hypothetical protein